MNLKKRKWLVVPVVAGSLAIFVGCGGDDGPSKPVIHNNKLILNFYNADTLGSDWLFQVWAHNNSGWNVGPAFNLVYASGKEERQLIDTLGQPIPDNKVTFPSIELDKCDSLRVTLQESVATDSSQAGLVFLAVAVGSSLAPKLESPLKASIQVGGQHYYVHATPTDASLENEISGIWFAGSELDEPGLDSLPNLPSGWIFEGWVYHATATQGVFYLSMGKFSQNTGPDQSHTYYDNAAGAPPYPGEDFIKNPGLSGLDFPLQFDEGDSVMVTFEPAIDPAPNKPFLRWRVLRITQRTYEIVPRIKQFMTAENYEDHWPKANAFIEDE